MKNWFFALAVLVASTLAVMPVVSEAKRFGGGSSSGMQRSLPKSAPTKPAAPQQAAAPTAGGAPAAAAAKRSWMGPIAGLAAGLGIAALMSHLGLGEEFGNFLMLALLAMAAVFAIRYFMRRAGGANAQPQQLAGAGAATPSLDKLVPAEADTLPRRAEFASGGGQMAADGRTLLSPMGAAEQAPLPAVNLPADFDAEGFQRIAKMIFVRMQAANDAADLNDLRAFTTPEMFAMARVDLQERQGKTQSTDVIKVDAEVLDLAKDGERQVVSVRYHGQIREEPDAPVENFDEIWHLVRFGDNPAWSISGIQQRH